MANIIEDLRKDLRKPSNSKRAKVSLRFFKTGKGQYGEGDKFLGVSVPDQRKIAKKYHDLGFEDLEVLLNSKIHEERLTALFILVSQFKKGVDKVKKEIFSFYLKNIKGINNWDLVDSSAPNIIGSYLLDRDRAILYAFAKSKSIWERRIAIISTFAFINLKKSYEDTFAISDILLHDNEDLIQKATGWMLREVGKRVSEDELKEYLKTRYKTMPRTTLRYAIEKFDLSERKKYLAGMI